MADHETHENAPVPPSDASRQEPITPAPPSPEAPAAHAAPEAAPEAPAAAPERVESLFEKAGKPEEKPAEHEAKPEEKPEEKPAAEAKPEEKPADKPAEAAKPEGEKPAEGEVEKPAEAAPEPISYAELKLPEGLSKDERLDAFTGLLGEHRVPVETAEKMLTMHTEAMKAYADQVASDNQKAFLDTRAGWVKEVMADPVLGGAGFQTAMGAVGRMRDMLVPAEDMPAFTEMLNTTGVGDHPLFLKMLHNAARIFDEPSLPSPNAKPPRQQTRQSNRELIYDHPTSKPGRQ